MTDQSDVGNYQRIECLLLAVSQQWGCLGVWGLFAAGQTFKRGDQS